MVESWTTRKLARTGVTGLDSACGAGRGTVDCLAPAHPRATLAEMEDVVWRWASGCRRTCWSRCPRKRGPRPWPPSQRPSVRPAPLAGEAGAVGAPTPGAPARRRAALTVDRQLRWRSARGPGFLPWMNSGCCQTNSARHSPNGPVRLGTRMRFPHAAELATTPLRTGSAARTDVIAGHPARYEAGGHPHAEKGGEFGHRGLPRHIPCQLLRAKESTVVGFP